MRKGGVCDVLVFEEYCLTDSFSSCCFDIDVVAAVMLLRRSEVPSCLAMVVPRTSLGWRLVYLDGAAEWG